MREIKFRAWNMLTKTMLDLKKVTPLALNMDTDGLFIPFSGMPLMQFTGLRDKNGKEIYEGDVLKYEMDPYRKFPWVVIFEDGAFKKEIQNTWSRKINLSSDELNRYEVIGNIYEHPDLLDS